MWFFTLGWIFTVVTVLGNALVMYLIITRPRLHVTANWFVLSLALADLCVGLTYFPLLFTSNFYPEVISIDHTGLWFKISHTFLYSSSTNLCALTADRYLAITMPLKYPSFMTRKRLILFLAFAWIAPLILFTLPSIFTYSSGNYSFTFFFETFRVSIFQLVPSVLFIFATGRLCFIARNISREESFLLAQIRFNFKPQQNVERRKHRDKKASVKMIAFIILFFILCHVGGNYQCFCFVFNLCIVPETLKKVIHLLFVVNSAVNPLVYSVLKKDIKKELRRMGIDRLWHCCFFP